MPADVTNVSGTVRDGDSNWISIKLQNHQIQNLPKAALITINLAGKDHLLFLSDTAAMLRDLATCEKYETDPLRSAR